MADAQVVAAQKDPGTVTATPSGGPVLQLRDLTHVYTRRGVARTILNNVDIDIVEGEFVSVMGPSGCGKTTLLNLVAGFEQPSGGRIHCRGQRVRSAGVDRGVVLQKPALFPWMNVVQNVMFGLQATKRSPARDQAEQLLSEVGLEGYSEHKTYELSGGMQHRVAIARTLATQPAVLLMDEPFGALDAQTRSEMQAFLLDLWQRHRSTVIFVTHDIEEGCLLSDRIVVLGKGDEGVREVVPIPIGRPRDYETVMTAEFIELRKKVRELITRS